MQTTLLGLAIAFIVAMVTALIGPYFIDWNQFRPQFEAEASRVIGAPVRVSGALDARLLPTPSLQLYGVTIGGGYDLGKVRADKLDVEFDLGALMRGEWRATELTIGGASADIGLDAQGRIDLPISADKFNLGALAIDRMNLTGRIALYDAASRSTLELNDIAYRGDFRSLAGAMRGDGNFTLSGARYPFRVSSGPAADGNGVRIHLNVDPGERPLSLDVDGIVTFAARAPRFDGVIVVAQPAPLPSQKPANDQAAQTPWRIAGKLKLDPAAAKLDQLELSYGPEDAALKASGGADFKFGDTPKLNATLSVRQFDADRLLASGGSDKQPTRLITQIGELIAALPQTPLATQINVSAEQIMLGGRPIQNIDADLHGDKSEWTISRLDLRAPGATKVALSGEVNTPGSSASFKGPVNIDSADPDTLAAWLQGRSEVAYRSQKPLRLSGTVSAAADSFAIDALTGEIDGSAVEGHVRFADRSRGGLSSFNAALKAGRLDLDGFGELVRSLGGPSEEWPDSAQISLDLGAAISAGQEMRPFSAQFGYGPQTIALTRFKTGDATGLMLDGSGAFNRNDATGKLELKASSASLAHITSLLKPLAPSFAGRLSAMSQMPGRVNVNLALNLEKSREHAEQTVARAALDIKSPQLNGALSMSATPPTETLRGFDIMALMRSDVAVDTRLVAARPGDLLSLLGLSAVVAVGKGPLSFEATAKGNTSDPVEVTAKLFGTDLDADVKGQVDLQQTQPRAELALAIRKANIAPLIELNPTAASVHNLSLTSRVVSAPDQFALEDIDGAIGGSKVKGKVTLALGDEKSVNGDLGIDTIEIGPALTLALGGRSKDLAEPLGKGLAQGWRGQVAIRAERGTLPGGTELRPVSAVLKSEGNRLGITDFKAEVGGGQLNANVDVSESASGRAVTAQIQMQSVDSAALKYGAMTIPAGRVSLTVSVNSQGRSATGLQGALAGDGLVSFEPAKIAGLDPRAFDLAIAASDNGKIANDNALRRLIERAMSAGAMEIPSAQIPFVIKDGRLKATTTTLNAQGARLTLSGGYDFSADQVDVRAALAAVEPGKETSGAEVLMFLTGSRNRMDRLIDVSNLSSWLAVRAINRETKRLDELQREMPAVLKREQSNPEAGSTDDDAVESSTKASPGQQNLMKESPARDEPARRGEPGSDEPARRDNQQPVQPPRAESASPSAPNVFNPIAREVIPLPAPIEIKPLPRARPTRPHTSAPMVLTPSVSPRF